MNKLQSWISRDLKAAHLPKSTTVSIFASMALSAGVAVGLAPAPVQAQVVLDKTTGSWSAPQGANSALNTVLLQTVGLQNQIRWGTSTGFGQSGLGFTGVDPTPNITLFPGIDFQLGTLQHFNNPINLGTALDSVTLNLLTSFQGPPVSINFLYSTVVNETLNAVPCAFPSGNTPCADQITISSVADQASFKIGNDDFTIASFFVDDNGIPVSALTSQERGTTTARLFGRLTKVPGQAPGDEVPGPLPVLGIAAAFGFSRKLRKRIQAS